MRGGDAAHRSSLLLRSAVLPLCCAQALASPSSSSSSSPSVSAPAPAVSLPGHPSRERAYSKHDIGALTAPQKEALSLMRKKVCTTPHHTTPHTHHTHTTPKARHCTRCPPALSLTAVLCCVRCGAGMGCGVVWCGVVWCGVVWCGVVWCVVLCVRCTRLLQVRMTLLLSTLTCASSELASSTSAEHPPHQLTAATPTALPAPLPD